MLHFGHGRMRKMLVQRPVLSENRKIRKYNLLELKQKHLRNPEEKKPRVLLHGVCKTVSQPTTLK